MASIFSWFKSNRKYMGIVKQEVNKYDLLKISDVIAKVKTVWSEIDHEMIKHCIENMPIRLNKWIEASGDWINY